MLVFITATLLSFLVTPAVIWYAKKSGLVDDKRIRKHPANTHKGIVPRAGGLAISIALLLSIAFFIPGTKAIIGITIGIIITAVVGLWDDYKDTSPYIRFGFNILAAIVVVGFGISAPYITNPLGEGVIMLDTWRISFEFLGQHSVLVWSALFSVVWIVWMMNAVGWSAGVDGQFPGFVVIASVVIAMLAGRYVAFDSSQQTVISLALITAGVYLGFLFWNFYPQKIMPGYSGKSLAGFMLAILAIVSGAKVGTALLVLGVPLADAFYTLVRRIMAGKSPFRADRGHLHHRLLDLGWGRRRIAVFYWGVTALLGVVALGLNSSQGKFFIFLFLVVAVGILLISLKLFHMQEWFRLGKK